MDPVTETAAPAGTAVASQVTALCHAHAAGLVRLAMLMLGDQSSAEDVVRDALLVLSSRQDAFSEPDRAVAYARASVLSGCRDALRRRSRPVPAVLLEPAEARPLVGEEHRELFAALHRLPGRQREAVILRYCLGLPEGEAAEAMKVSQATVKASSHHGLAALAGILREAQPGRPRRSFRWLA